MLIPFEDVRVGIIQTDADTNVSGRISNPTPPPSYTPPGFKNQHHEGPPDLQCHNHPAHKAGQWRHGRRTKEPHAGRRNHGHADTTGNLAKHMITPRTSEKRYEAPDGSIYIDWKLPKFGVTTPNNRTKDGMLREVG